MPKSIVLLSFFLLSSLWSYSQEVELIEFNSLKARMDTTKEVVVYNFWATWCKPCVAELPYFEKINAKYEGKKVKIVLVNLDFNSKTETLVIPFVKRNKLKSTVLQIIDTDPNEWINQVDSSWSGAIPATLILRAGIKKFFVEKEMTYEELEEIVARLAD